ncbi:MAG: hypothetical protein ACXIVO_07180 [Glycocaulis sp.]
MLGVAIDISHWIAGAVLALVGIAYDRAEDCTPAVRQQSFEEARFMDDAATIHFLASEVYVEQTRTVHGELIFVVRNGPVEPVSGCASAPGHLPSVPAAPVLRL